MSNPTDQNSFDHQKVVFLHIPKTAGMTFTSILKSLFPENEIFPAYQAFKLREDFEQNEKLYRLFAGHWDYSDIERFQAKPVVLTFLRDPIERMASQFYHLKKSPDDAITKNRLRPWDKRLVQLAKEMEFEKFCAFDDSEIDRMANLQTRHLCGKVSTPNPGPEKEKERADLIGQAIQNIRQIEFVGIVEEFELSLKLFFRMFRLSEEMPEYKSININKVRPREINRAVFEENAVAKNRIELDRQLYETGKEIFYARLKEYGIDPSL